MECLAYFTRLWNERVNAPPGHDLISMLAHGESTRNMAPMEYLGNLILLIVGGNDTTRNSISGGVLALNQNPDEYQKLRDDPHADHEAWCRRSSAGRRRSRTCAAPRSSIPNSAASSIRSRRQGADVVHLRQSRRRPPSTRPNAFIIDRPNARHHLAFGFGIHRCMGNRLAEMQLRVVWEEIMKRFRLIEVVGEPVRTFSAFVHGYTQLPVKVHAA